ncbi:MAG: pyridoxamine 5'-phosphate oxidase family protein [Bacillota bacterium]|nr:pyridoxamine 5'-phosphate oxidase family protein [Bacillota bacterium]
MNEVLKFLTDNPTFYIATVDGDKPKVRPFGFVMEFEGKLWFCTNNKKNVYKQLKTNPCFEVSTTSPDRNWIRLKGKAVFNSTTAAKAKALEVAPILATMYSVEDSIFEVFYVEEGEATFYSMTGDSRTIKL